MTAPSSRRDVRVALIGFGAINQRVAELLATRDAPVRIAAIARRRAGSPIPSIPDAQVLMVPAELASVDADLVVEAAGREAVLPWGEVALRTAGAFVVSSSSAFTDDTVLDRLKRIAEAHGSQLVISPGAVAGIEAIAAASRLGLDLLVHTIVKPPLSWRGSPAETLVNLDGLQEPVTFFTGTARDAATRFPANANVTVVTALSGARGLDATQVELVADPRIAANRHVIRAAGAFGNLSVEIENRPLASNAKSSELAALALVRLIEDAASGMRI